MRLRRDDDSPSPLVGRPVALALGAGGARGIAHIMVLEALDELGLRPSVIVGTSMGAIVGAIYAAGFSGQALRLHVFRTLRRRQYVLARLLEARVGRFADILTRGLTNPVLVDAELLLELLWPSAMPDDFESLRVPLFVIATDFYAQDEVVLHAGDLRSAVAASMAIPGLVRPVIRAGRVLIDGGAVNPLPYDLVSSRNALVLACDVGRGPMDAAQVKPPTPFEAMFGAAQMMQSAIATKMVQANPPDVLIRPPVNQFKALDFFRFAQILRAAETVKDDIKRQVEQAVSGR